MRTLCCGSDAFGLIKENNVRLLCVAFHSVCKCKSKSENVVMKTLCDDEHKTFRFRDHFHCIRRFRPKMCKSAALSLLAATTATAAAASAASMHPHGRFDETTNCTHNCEMKQLWWFRLQSLIVAISSLLFIFIHSIQSIVHNF